MMKKLLTALAASSLAIATSAHAAPVTWTLQNWVFNDGGTASGSFDFNASTSAYTNISVLTTNGTVRTGASYSIANPGSSGNATFAAWVTGLFANFTGTPVVAVDWASALTDAGGTVGVNFGGFHGEYDCVNALCNGGGSPFRLLTSGAVTTAAIPLPATLPLVGLAVVMLGVVRRRHS